MLIRAGLQLGIVRRTDVEYSYVWNIVRKKLEALEYDIELHYVKREE